MPLPCAAATSHSSQAAQAPTGTSTHGGRRRPDLPLGHCHNGYLRHPYLADSGPPASISTRVPLGKRRLACSLYLRDTGDFFLDLPQIFWAVDVDGCIMVLFLIDNMGSGDFFSMLLLY